MRNIDATAKHNVARLAAMASNTFCGENFGTSTVLQPVNRGSSRDEVRPNEWKKGSMPTNTSSSTMWM